MSPAVSVSSLATKHQHCDSKPQCKPPKCAHKKPASDAAPSADISLSKRLLLMRRPHRVSCIAKAVRPESPQLKSEVASRFPARDKDHSAPSRAEQQRLVWQMNHKWNLAMNGQGPANAVVDAVRRHHKRARSDATDLPVESDEFIDEHDHPYHHKEPFTEPFAEPS